MTPIKKSFNMDADLARRVDDFIIQNPGVSATLIFNQAVKMWLQKPNVSLNRTPATDDDVDKFLQENSGLMDDLAK